MFFQYCLGGLIIGMLYALIALGYTMVYGIVELINFAHGDLFMLGTFMALTLLSLMGISVSTAGEISTSKAALAIAVMMIVVPLFCATLNVAVDKVVYRPLRSAPKLAPLVSAIGVSFCFMNIGLFWNAAVYEDGRAVPAASQRAFPNIVSNENILERSSPVEEAVTTAKSDKSDSAKDSKSKPTIKAKEESKFRITWKDAMVIAVTIPSMIFLTWFVKFTQTGKAMRATAQNPTAARLMGINVDRVIATTFLIGGALGGVGSVTYALYINTTSYQVGFQNGLYAFTAAVLGGIGNIPGAVLGGIIIGLVRSLGSAYIDEKWTSAFVFAILILILVFRPTGLLGSRTREKV
ncbi:branched-chain amino acid ABC transporter permease [Telmatocola sphagniphila]|uniref:Branched-chain amino acid ABC transporter permease n=2 Tax=Telmatocola sphagniphila TaxID=1123043 RepID=A0A8E6BBF9_9BACT|nr:branched-chain amino acid ABC transporter permease [Telmatocola sphagniphila]